MAVLPTPGSPMSAGLFFVLRPRIWMTRSISFSRPMTGSRVPARAASVRLMPSWSSVGVLDGRFVSCAGAVLLDLAQDVDDLVADLVEVDAQALEHAGGDALALADEAEEEVLGPDVVVAEAPRLVDGQLDDPLRAGRQPDLTDDRAVAASDDELDGGADLGQLDVHVLEHARRDALALADEAEEEVLGTDVVVVEALRLVLGEGQHLPRSIGELVESIHGSPAFAGSFCLAVYGTGAVERFALRTALGVQVIIRRTTRIGSSFRPSADRASLTFWRPDASESDARADRSRRDCGDARR